MNRPLPYCHIAILPYCHIAILSYCHIAILPYCHIAILSYCHTAILPYCHIAILPSLHHRSFKITVPVLVSITRTPYPSVKVNSKSDHINLVAPAGPIECLLYLPNVWTIQYKLGPERLTRLGNSNVLRLPGIKVTE